MTTRDHERFLAINTDRSKVEEKASIIKLSEAELRDLPSDIAVILHKKLNQLSYIKRGINTLVSVGSGIGLFAKNNQSLLTALNVVRDNSSDISRFILPYTEPDFDLNEDANVAVDKPIVVSDTRPVDVAGVLRKFSVPEGVASEIQDIYETGPTLTNITAILTHLFNFAGSRATKKAATEEFGGLAY